MGKLIARTDHKIIKSIFGIEGKFDRRKVRRRQLIFKRGERFLLFFYLTRGEIVFDLKMELIGFMRQIGEGLFDMVRIMLMDPFPEETIWDFHFNFISLQRKKLNGFNPDIEILRTNSLFQSIGHLGPQIFHELGLKNRRRKKKMIYGMGGPDQKRKY